MDLQISVDARTASGKKTKGLRAQGIVPGVVFGKTAGSVPVQLDAKAFEALYREAGRTSIIKLTVDGSDSKATSVLIKSVQRNPLTGRAIHVDFFAPDLTHEMQAEVPIIFTGTAPGVEASGGSLFTSLDHLKVKALPSDIPHEFTVDVSPLVDLDTAILVRDLPVADNVTVLNDPEELVAKVMPPRVEVEPEPEVGEELEGEGVEGAAEGGEAAEGEAAEGEAPSSAGGGDEAE